MALHYLKGLDQSIKADNQAGDLKEAGGNMEMLILNRVFTKVNKCKFSSEGCNLDWKSALGGDERKVFKKFICESGKQFNDLNRYSNFKIEDLC